MTPLPKNKITRAERGKRRSGNTPKLVRDTKVTKVPLNKAKVVAKMKMMFKPVKKVDEKEQKAKLAEKLSTKKAKKAPSK